MYFMTPPQPNNLLPRSAGDHLVKLNLRNISSYICGISLYVNHIKINLNLLYFTLDVHYFSMVACMLLLGQMLRHRHFKTMGNPILSFGQVVVASIRKMKINIHVDVLKGCTSH